MSSNDQETRHETSSNMKQDAVKETADGIIKPEEKVQAAKETSTNIIAITMQENNKEPDGTRQRDDTKPNDNTTSDRNDIVTSPSDEDFTDSLKDEPHVILTKSDSVSSSMSTLSSMTADESPLLSAARDMDIKAIKELLIKSDHVNVNQTTGEGYTALHEMIKSYVKMDIEEKMCNRKKLEEIVILLVKRGLDVNAVDHGKKKQSALHIIAQYDVNEDVIKILTAVGMRVNLVNAFGETALHRAVEKVAAVNVEALLQGGAEPNVQDHRGQTALHLAAKGPRHLTILLCLLKCGANTQAIDKGGRTPLHIAAKLGRADLVRELLIGGADPNCVDVSGQTPLHFAAAHDLTGAVLRQLLDRPSIKINLPDAIYGETALHKIVRFQRMENLKAIATKKRQLKVSSRDHSGNTALHHASHCHNIMLWQTLLSINADSVSLTNDQQLTPMQLASKAKNHVAVAMINQCFQPEESNA